MSASPFTVSEKFATLVFEESLSLTLCLLNISSFNSYK